MAVANYCEARPLLKKYGHQGAFRSVAADCETVMERVTENLKERLQDPQQSADACVQLLRELGNDFGNLQVRHATMTHELTKCAATLGPLSFWPAETNR